MDKSPIVLVVTNWFLVVLFCAILLGLGLWLFMQVVTPSFLLTLEMFHLNFRPSKTAESYYCWCVCV